MMVGRNRPNEYKPDRIAKYAVAESQSWMLKTPRLTSDHRNFSGSDMSVEEIPRAVLLCSRA